MIKYFKCAILFAILPSIVMAQEAATNPRFVGLWLHTNPAQKLCRNVLKIDMVSDTQTNLGFGDSPTTVRMEVHDVAGPPEFRAVGNILSVKYELKDRDKPITIINSFRLVDDNTVKATLVGYDGYVPCDYTKATPGETPQK